MDAHSFVARNFAHLYAVGGRQHSMGAVAKMQRRPNKISGVDKWKFWILLLNSVLMQG